MSKAHRSDWERRTDALVNGVYDAEGRFISFRMSEAELRLECLKLSVTNYGAPTPEGHVSIAKTMSDFVLGQPASSAVPTSATQPPAAISDLAKGILRERISNLRSTLSYEESWAAASTAESAIHNRQAADLRQAIADLERDLGEPPTS